MTLRDLAPWIAVLAAIATFCWSIWVRVVDLRWKRLELVRTLFADAKENADVRTALNLLDIDGCDLYDIDGETIIETVSWDKTFLALVRLNDRYEDEISWQRDLRIRQSFDALFEFLTELEHGVRSKQLPMPQIEDRLEYAIGCIAAYPGGPKIVADYCKAAGFKPALALLNRFKGFRDAWASQTSTVAVDAK